MPREKLLRSLGLRLRQLREARGLTQEELGQTCFIGIERPARHDSSSIDVAWETRQSVELKI